jgi:hypothetical protein
MLLLLVVVYDHTGRAGYGFNYTDDHDASGSGRARPSGDQWLTQGGRSQSEAARLSSFAGIRALTFSAFYDQARWTLTDLAVADHALPASTRAEMLTCSEREELKTQ